MKTLSSAAIAVALLAIAGSAGAADLSPIIVAPMPAFNWSGFYAGAHLGYSWGNDSTVEYLTGTDILTGASWKYRTDGVVGGGFAGYNYEKDSIVVGAEADIEATDMRGSFLDAGGLGKGTARIDWQGSLRARVGVAAFDRGLIYATSGAALGDIRYVYTNIPLAIDEPVTKTRVGWTVGAGFEYALTDNITLRTEYRYTDYGTFRIPSQTAFGPAVAPPNGLTGEQHPYSSSARIGVAYRF